MNILIIRFSALGDLVTLEPTFRAIRHFYKDANITLITSSIGKGLYEDSDYINTFIAEKSFFDIISKSKKSSYDIVFNLHCNSLAHGILFFISYKKLVNISANLIQKLFNIKVKGKNLKTLLENSGVKLVELNSYFSDPSSKIVSLPFKIVKEIQGCEEKTVAISTGSSEKWLSKKWGIDNYIQLILKLIDENINVIIAGSSLELEDSKKILSKVPEVKSFVNKTNLTELKNILGSVDLYIGNDSGPTHISAAVGTNTFTIFGSTGIEHSPAFGNYEGKHSYISPSNKIQCHPCYKQVCPTHMECMKDITVEKVYNRIMDILNG